MNNKLMGTTHTQIQTNKQKNRTTENVINIRFIENL